MPEFYKILPQKLSKYPKIFMIFAWKIYKIPEFHMIFARKVPKFYVLIAQKNVFSQIIGGHVPPLPPSPTPMAWAMLSAAIKKQYNSVLPLLRHCLPVFDKICVMVIYFVLFVQVTLTEIANTPLVSDSCVSFYAWQHMCYSACIPSQFRLCNRFADRHDVWF